MSDSIVISGFGREDVNGVYEYWADKNGYPAYKNASGYIVMYEGGRMPYANDGGYVLIIPQSINGSIRLDLVPYLKISDAANVATSGWVSTLANTSGETATEQPFYESSSGSSASSVSSQSSSSSLSTSSSSSIDSSSSRSSQSSQSSSSSSLSSVSQSSSSSSSSSKSTSSSSSTLTSASSGSSSSSSKSNSSSSSSSSQSSQSSSSSSKSASTQSNSSLSSRSLSSQSSQSSQTSSSSSKDSSSTSSMDAYLRVSNSGYASTLDGNYTYSGRNQNGRRVFDKDNQYYFTWNGTQWVLTDDFFGTTVAKWNQQANGYPDGLNDYYNPTDYPVASGIFVAQYNIDEQSYSSSSQSSQSSSSNSSSSSKSGSSGSSSSSSSSS